MNSRARITIAALSLSAAGLVGIAVREGYTDAAIIPTKGDVPTYGFGMTTRPDGTPVQLGDRTTPVRALMDTASKLDTMYEASVRRCVKVPLHQAEYDVYVSMAYNIGTSAFCGSSIVKRANAQDYTGACEAILMWKMYQGIDCSKPNKVCAGLWKDRLRDHGKCMAAQ
jgi:lysozyme